ncbi:hypothetical protein [Pontibacter sp. G13]|uniref:hypothetical protein n=1 Tax=Pontibacter sp. G13 TaxID=3074898 RepID=UPI00288B13F9|nr:hypothetical protein [Pontibacter sp. G13]WNJ20680.1 hypothetical protein RJD25_09370 [Pontibacter sp. G13]
MLAFRSAFLLVSMLASYSLVFGQFLEPDRQRVIASDIIFLEVLGNGEYYSLNYEQTFLSNHWLGLAARFGVGAYPASRSKAEVRIPTTISAFMGRDRLFIEAGVGVTFSFDSELMEQGSETVPTGIFGLRLHPYRNGGLFLKMAYTPLFRPDDHRHGFGIAMGWGLGR